MVLTKKYSKIHQSQRQFDEYCYFEKQESVYFDLEYFVMIQFSSLYLLYH